MAEVERMLAPSKATTRRAMLIIPLIFAGPLTNSISRQAHAPSSPEANSRSPQPPSTFRVMASVQRVRASSTITTQRARFSLFPSVRYAHQKLGQFAKARPQPACTKQNHPPSRGTLAFATPIFFSCIGSSGAGARRCSIPCSPCVCFFLQPCCTDFK
jgi:hypothetical protein